MAEPLKKAFGPEVAAGIADSVLRVHPDFDAATFLNAAADGFEELELLDRARHISRALAETLPEDRSRAIDILIASLGPQTDSSELSGMESFRYMPLTCFVAEEGLGCFETSMRAQYELTKRFTAEFSIRAFLEHDPARTLERLHQWADDPNVHVRRLVSEGTRPRLPWAPRLRAFQADPAPVLQLLEKLKDDPEEYVRRSVANNLNDIAKDHPDVVVGVARRWWKGGSEDRRRLVRHALRTLVKAGHPAALRILGYSKDSPVRVAKVSCEPQAVRIGDKVRVEVELTNPSAAEAAALVDFRVHFVKANGATSPKVFKGTEVVVPAGQSTSFRRTVSLRQHTTRKHYPGRHEVDLLVNGECVPGCHFELT